MMLTAMIWRMERRTVVAAMVGGNCNMDETLEAIWAEVTIQSNALLPVLRLMALRAMKNTTELYRDWKAKCSILYFISFRVAPPHKMKISGLSKRDLKDSAFVGRPDNSMGKFRCIHRFHPGSPSASLQLDDEAASRGFSNPQSRYTLALTWFGNTRQRDGTGP